MTVWRLDRRAALRAPARGGPVADRVFFADQAAAGFRPCAVCLPDEYATWNATVRP
jgi:methylphosphotriester-DNA--protein-cysteine methyltransferase